MSVSFYICCVSYMVLYLFFKLSRAYLCLTQFHGSCYCLNFDKLNGTHPLTISYTIYMVN